MYERTLTINGFSKAFAMTGWRVGYACGAEEIISVMNKVHQYGIMCAPRMGQVAAEEALRLGRENGYADVLAMRESYDRRRRLMVESFRSMGLPCFEPYGAFYAFRGIGRRRQFRRQRTAQFQLFAVHRRYLHRQDSAAAATAFAPAETGHTQKHFTCSPL